MRHAPFVLTLTLVAASVAPALAGPPHRYHAPRHGALVERAFALERSAERLERRGKRVFLRAPWRADHRHAMRSLRILERTTVDLRRTIQRFPGRKGLIVERARDVEFAYQRARDAVLYSGRVTRGLRDEGRRFRDRLHDLRVTLRHPRFARHGRHGYGHRDRPKRHERGVVLGGRYETWDDDCYDDDDDDRRRTRIGFYIGREWDDD